MLKSTSVVVLLVLTVARAAAASPPAPAWPEFRGPTGQGHATGTSLPVEWSTTKNVTWKQPVPGLGWSSPVIGGGRVFLTAGVAGEGGGTSLREGTRNTSMLDS